MKSEIERFPRLFRAVESVPGLTWPTLVFEKRLTLWLGKLQVEIMQLGRGHTKGDTVVWLPQEKILFSGDLVEYDATPYTGDAYLTDWPATLDAIAALQPEKLVPGRGAALHDARGACKAGLDGTRAFVTEMFDAVKRGAAAGKDLRSVYQRDVRGAEAEVRPLGDLRSLPAVRRVARLRRGDAVPATRGSGPPSATRRCGKRWKAERCRRAQRGAVDEDLREPGLSRTTRPPEHDAPGARAGRSSSSAPGPVGLAAAIDLGAARRSGRRARRRSTRCRVGSRAICYAKRTLEILDRLGCGERIVRQGRRAGTSARSSSATSSSTRFDLLPEPGHRRPAFVNLQQYYLEEYLVERAARAAGGRAALAEQGRRRRAARRTTSLLRVDTPGRRVRGSRATG